MKLIPHFEKITQKLCRVLASVLSVSLFNFGRAGQDDPVHTLRATRLLNKTTVLIITAICLAIQSTIITCKVTIIAPLG